MYSKKICRFCLEYVENFVIINNKVREAIGSLCTVNFFSKNLHISVFNTDQVHAICEFCLTYLEKAEQLIQTSKQTQTKFSEALDCLPCKIIKLDWLPMFTNISKQDTVCCICFEIVNSMSVVFLHKNSTNVLPPNLIRRMLTYSTIVLSRRIMDPVMCLECWTLVQEVYTFKKLYDGVESRINIFCKNYAKTHVTSNDLYKIVYVDCHSARESQNRGQNFEKFNAASSSATLTGLEDVENAAETSYLSLQGVQSKQKVECWLSSLQNDVHREKNKCKKLQAAKENKADQKEKNKCKKLQPVKENKADCKEKNKCKKLQAVKENKADCKEKNKCKKLQAVKENKADRNKSKMKPNIKKINLRNNFVKQVSENVRKKRGINQKAIASQNSDKEDVHGLQIYLEHKFGDVVKAYRKKRKPNCYEWKRTFKKTETLEKYRRQSPFNCPDCNFITNSDIAVCRHMAGHKNGSLDLHICDVCGYKVPNRFTFANHLKTHKSNPSDPINTSQKIQIVQDCIINISQKTIINNIDKDILTSTASEEMFNKKTNLQKNYKAKEGNGVETTCLDKNDSPEEYNGLDEPYHNNSEADSDITYFDPFDIRESAQNVMPHEDDSSCDFLEKYNLENNEITQHCGELENQECASKNLEDTVGLSSFNNVGTESLAAEENIALDVFALLKNTNNNMTKPQKDINEPVSEEIGARKNGKGNKTRVADKNDLGVLETSDGEIPDKFESNVIQTRSRSRLGLLRKYRKQKHRSEASSSNESETPVNENKTSKLTDLSDPSNNRKKPTISTSECSKTISTVNETSNLNSLSENDEHSDNDNGGTFEELTISASEDEESANMLNPNQDSCSLQADNSVTTETVSLSDTANVNILQENSVIISDQNESSTRNNEDSSRDIFVVDSGDGLIENPLANNESEKNHSTIDDDVIFCEGQADPVAIYHKCEICDFSSCSSHSVKRHIQAHKEKKLDIFRCTQCPYKISHFRFLQEHLLTHPPLEISDGEDEILSINDGIENTEIPSQDEGEGTNTAKRISDEIIEGENDLGEVDIEKSNVVDIIKEHKELLDNTDNYNPNFRKPLIPLLRINDVNDINANNSEFNSDDDDEDKLEISAGMLISKIIDDLVKDDPEIQTKTSKPNNQFNDEQETLLLNDAGVETEYLTEEQEQELLKDDDHPPELLDLKSEAKCVIAKDEPPFLEPQTTVNEMNIQIESVWSVSEASTSGDDSRGITNRQKSATEKGCSGSCTDYVHYCQLVNSTVFLCVFCNTGFQSDVARIEHRRAVHPNLRFSYKCLLCPGEVFDRKDYIIHMLIDHNGLKYRCAICGKIFVGPEFLEQHVLAHSGITTTFCGFCMENNFSIKDVLCSCIKCGRNFSSYRILSEHSRNSNCTEDILSSVSMTNTNGSRSVLKRSRSYATHTDGGLSNSGISVSINENKKQIVEDQSQSVSAERIKNNTGSEAILKAHPTVFYRGKRLLVVNPKQIPTNAHVTRLV